MPKEVPEHRDLLGRLLNVGDCVAYPSSNSLVVGIVKKLNPKMIGVSQLGEDRWGDSNKYSNDLVILDGPDVTMYLIKNSG
jgi:hypothetical protein